MSEPHSIAIIGGGLIGVTCAAMLAREGHKTTIIESVGIGHGCSLGNGAQYNAGSSFPMAHPGILLRALSWLIDKNGPVHLAPREFIRTAPWLIRFLRTGRMKNWAAAFKALNALNGPCAQLYKDILGDAFWGRMFHPTGALHVWNSGNSNALSQISAQLRAEHGVLAQELGPAEIQELEPALSHHYQRGLYFPASGYVRSPLGLVENLLTCAMELGTTVVSDRVTAILPSNDKVTLKLTAGSIDADTVVIAAGIGSRDLARKLGLSLSLASERGYHITLPGVSSGLLRPVTDAASAFVATPLEEGLRIVGIAEFDDPKAPPNERQIAKLSACAQVMLPNISVDQISPWMGIRPSTPDSLPIIDRHPKFPSILFATGHGHMGISGAPMTAAIICDLIAHRPARIPIAPYRLR